MINIGLLGIGTVGTGVYEIIISRKKYLEKLFNDNINISKILVKDIEKKRQNDICLELLTENPFEVIENPEIDIVVEMIGGINPAYEYISKSLKNGKHVVTANKAVVAKYMNEFYSLARKYDRGFLFEASVGGGIPIVKCLKESIDTNEIKEIKGILNGTSNFILTKMCSEGISFEKALKLAQYYGYAEADPTDDIEGYDAARKVSILSSIAYNTNVIFEDVFCRGITSINKVDIINFKKLNLVVKLIGSSIYADNKYSASVEPVLLNRNSVFANTNNAFNIVSFKGSTVDELQFYGQGAGKNPTANAVVSDIIDIINRSYKSYDFIPSSNIKSAGLDLFEGKYYVRITPNHEGEISGFIDLLNKRNLKYHIISSKVNLIIITESISASKVNEIAIDIRSKCSNFCYLCIEDNLEQISEITNIDEVAIS